MPTASENRPTVLLVGRGEPLDAALRVALDRHGLFVEEAAFELRNAVKMTAPDLILLLGDAAQEGGRVSLELLAGDPLTATVPVAVLGPAEAFDARVRAFRHGAVAVIPRVASVDAMATQIAAVANDLGDRGQRPDELGEATLDDLVQLVGRELRNGILTVEPAQQKDREGQPLRIVLGAGRPVAAAVEEFVRKLAPLVSRAEPLVYELHQGPGGAVALVDGEGERQVDARIFEGLRVLVIDSDPSRADALAQELRGRKATVAVADAAGGGLERARALDPDVVLVDTQGIEGPGFEVVRRIRADHRLRWASLLVVPWDELWPSPEGAPDVGRLAEQIEPLVVPDRVLRDRAEKERAFETRLEATGPSRLLRALAGLVGPFHVSVRSSKALVEVDVAEGLVVGATGATAKGERLEGARALAALLSLGAGRARVEHRSHAATANLMVPVDQALALADREGSPVPHSLPPPSNRPAPPSPLRPDRRSDRSGPYRSLGAMPTRAQPQAGRVVERDLRWTDSSMDSSWKDPEPAFPPMPEERTKEIEVPSVPPGVASRTSLPTGIASVVTEGSVMAPLPIKPAASARMSAFAAPTIREPRATPAVPAARGLVLDDPKNAAKSIDSWGTGTTSPAMPAAGKGASPQGASPQGASLQGASLPRPGSQGSLPRVASPRAVSATAHQRPTVKSSTVDAQQHGQVASKAAQGGSETTARPGEVKRPLETARPAPARAGIFSDTPGTPTQRDEGSASRNAVPSGAFSGGAATSPGSQSSPNLPAAPRATVARPPAVTPVAIPAVGAGRTPASSSRPAGGRTLAFGAPTAPATPEVAAARFPRHARTVQGIQGESADAVRGDKPTPLATPAAVTAAAHAVAAPVVSPPVHDEPPTDELPAALFGDDEPELPAVLRDGLPDVPAPQRSEPPQDPSAAVDDVLATLGALGPTGAAPAPAPVAPTHARPAALRDAPPPIDLPDPSGRGPALDEPVITHAHTPSAFTPFTEGVVTETSAARPLVDLGLGPAPAVAPAPANAFAQTVASPAAFAPPAASQAAPASYVAPATPYTPTAPAAAHAPPAPAAPYAAGHAPVAYAPHPSTTTTTVVSTAPPPAPRRSFARVAAIVLVVLGGLSLLAVGAVMGAYRMGMLASLGFSPGAPVTTITPPATTITPPATTPPVTTVTPPETTTVTPPETTTVTPPETTTVTPPETTTVTPPETTTGTEEAEAGGEDVAALIEQAGDARDSAVRERLYRRALELDPRNHYAMVGLAEVYMGRNQPSQAIPLIESAIRRRRGRAEFRVLLGDARQQAGDTSGAQAAWREALEIDPDNRQAQRRLGE